MNNRKAMRKNLAKEAELFKLRQQLQPHFLFNSLKFHQCPDRNTAGRSEKNGTAII